MSGLVLVGLSSIYVCLSVSWRVAASQEYLVAPLMVSAISMSPRPVMVSGVPSFQSTSTENTSCVPGSVIFATIVTSLFSLIATSSGSEISGDTLPIVTNRELEALWPSSSVTVTATVLISESVLLPG